MLLSTTRTKEMLIFFARVAAVNKPGAASERSRVRPGTIEASSHIINITLLDSPAD